MARFNHVAGKYGVEVITVVLTFHGEPGKLVSNGLPAPTRLPAHRGNHISRNVYEILEFQRHLAARIKDSIERARGRAYIGAEKERDFYQHLGQLCA